MNTPETPDLAKGPQNSMPYRVLKAPGAGGFEAFQDTLPNRRGDSEGGGL